MNWNYHQIRRNIWNTCFHRGVRAWLALVAVCFIFAFIGSSNSSQVSFVDTADQLIGAENDLLPGNIDILKEYIVNAPVVKNNPFITSDFALGVLDSLTKSVTWVVRLLAVNRAYFERNPGEVIAGMALAALLAAAVRFLIQNVLLVGRNRYVMETRFQQKVPFRRILAPFHKEHLGNIIRVMLCYHVVLTLWMITIIGGVYKSYQYSMVPYILAENPSVTWREAKRLSAAMTKGYKWKMFCTWLSYLYIWILKAVPVAGICVAVPLEAELNAEMYFALRGNPLIDQSLLIEKAFDQSAVVPAESISGPAYLLKDLDLEPLRHKPDRLPYRLTDIIFFFFAFCMIGWLWEVGLHLVKDGVFVNRGTMYGPWIPIYGTGGVAILLLLGRFKANAGKLFAMAVMLCAVLEYFSSFLLDFLYNSSYWDYKTMFLNINGRICLAGLLAFGIGGLFDVYVAAPLIVRFTNRFSPKTRKILAAVLIAAFLTDLICCLIFGFNSGAGVGGSI